MISPFSLFYPLLLLQAAYSFAPRPTNRHRLNPTHAIRDSTTTTTTTTTTTHQQRHRRRHDHHDELLWSMTRFFGEDMLDSYTRRFYYACHPIDETREHFHFPIRDLAAAWDATKALEFANRLLLLHASEEESAAVAGESEANVIRVQKRLRDGIKCTLLYYTSNLNSIIRDEVEMMGTTAESILHLKEEILMEPPTIAHSALLLLGICDSFRSSSVIERDDDDDDDVTQLQSIVDGLTRGILSKQLKNGAFGIEFCGSDNYLQGIGFFPGEAMLSLMHVHDLYTTMPEIILRNKDPSSSRCAILPAMERAFRFYSDYYYAQDDLDVNYNIWQVLAFAKYCDALNYDRTTTTTTLKKEVKKYILDMCHGICESRSWKHQLRRGKPFYVNLETVEIACGLDALAEGIRIAREERQWEEDDDDDDRSDTDALATLAKSFEMHARNALYFLEWSVDQAVPDGLGEGGLGYGGTQVFEQRLDVTGHAISALVKLRNISVLLP